MATLNRSRKSKLTRLTNAMNQRGGFAVRFHPGFALVEATTLWDAGSRKIQLVTWFDWSDIAVASVDSFCEELERTFAKKRSELIDTEKRFR